MLSLWEVRRDCEHERHQLSHCTAHACRIHVGFASACGLLVLRCFLHACVFGLRLVQREHACRPAVHTRFSSSTVGKCVMSIALSFDWISRTVVFCVLLVMFLMSLTAVHISEVVHFLTHNV